MNSLANYATLIESIRETVRSILPRDSKVIVASKGDDALLDLDCPAWHFPQTDDGVYAGHHPADSVEAVRLLETVRAKGGQFFLLPGTSFWWLDYYTEFSKHLGDHYERIWSDDQCIIYRLTVSEELRNENSDGQSTRSTQSALEAQVGERESARAEASLSSTGTVGLVSPLLYRFGFICFPSDEHPVEGETWRPLSSNWHRFAVDGLTFYVHPETPLRVHREIQGTVVFLGDVFACGGRSVLETTQAMLEATTDEDLYQLLDDLSGRFALFLIRGQDRRVFHDAFGARTLFYRNEGTFCIGSHAELIADAFGDSTRQDVLRLIETPEYRKKIVRYLPGDWTIYHELYALVPNNYYDVTQRRSVRYWPRKHRRPTVLTDFFAEADRYFVAFTTFLRAFYRPMLGVTGGIDSRGLMAAFSRYNLPFDGVTWLGGYLKGVEVPIVNELSLHVPGEYNSIPCKPVPSEEAMAQIASRNVGIYRGIVSPLRLTVPMRDLARDRSVFVRGYGGEIMRGFYNLFPRPIPSFDPVYFARAYGMGNKAAFYTRQSLAAAEGFFQRANYDGLESFGFDPNDVFYWEHRMGMWGAAMLNEMDPAMYSFTGYNSRRLYEAAFGLDGEVRLTKQLILELVRHYAPAMAEISFV